MKKDRIILLWDILIELENHVDKNLPHKKAFISKIKNFIWELEKNGFIS
jgi:hypothetical protein